LYLNFEIRQAKNLPEMKTNCIFFLNGRPADSMVKVTQVDAKGPHAAKSVVTSTYSTTIRRAGR
jgi:hypothetical protein